MSYHYMNQLGYRCQKLTCTFGSLDHVRAGSVGLPDDGSKTKADQVSLSLSLSLSLYPAHTFNYLIHTHTRVPRSEESSGIRGLSFMSSILWAVISVLSTRIPVHRPPVPELIHHRKKTQSTRVRVEACGVLQRSPAQWSSGPKHFTKSRKTVELLRTTRPKRVFQFREWRQGTVESWQSGAEWSSDELYWLVPELCFIACPSTALREE